MNINIINKKEPKNRLEQKKIPDSCNSKARGYQLQRNIFADYIYCFLRNFDISSAIWVLYLDYRGLPLWQIGALEGIFHIASMLFEVPSGAIADLCGRKKVMIIGRLLYMIAAIIQITSGNFFLFAVAFVINAFSYNLNSGTEEAFLYDTMKALKSEHKYMKVNSNINMIIEISSGIATFIGGVLAQYSYVLCYSFVIILALISILPALFFVEPDIDKQRKEKSKKDQEEGNIFITHAKICYDICRKDTQVFKILLFFPIVETFYMIIYFYGQKYFSNMGYNKIQISLVMLFVGIMACLGAFFSTRILKWLQNKTRYVISILLGMAIGCLFIQVPIISIAAFGVSGFLNAVLYPIQSEALNKRIPSAQRATIISISSMFYSVCMVGLFPLSGALAQIIGLKTVFGLLGLFLVLLVFFIQVKYNQKQEKELVERI